MNFDEIKNLHLPPFFEDGEFAKNSYVLAKSKNLALIILENERSCTAIHAHFFNGFFLMLQGRVEVSTYYFCETKRSTCSELKFGEAVINSVVNLDEEVLPIHSELHKVNYLDEINYTLSIREINDKGRKDEVLDNLRLSYSTISRKLWDKIKNALANSDMSFVENLTLGQLVSLKVIPPPNNSRSLVSWMRLQQIIKNRTNEDNYV